MRASRLSVLRLRPALLIGLAAQISACGAGSSSAITASYTWNAYF